jgi:CheY-like chemotaxis protein
MSELLARDSASAHDPLVLIIDDDASIRSVIAEVLLEEGFRVEDAGDGATGLALAQQHHPDVVLLDIALPQRSGLEVMRALKEAAPTRDIPIVIVSAYALLLLGNDQRSADFVLSKPFDLAELLRAVHELATRADRQAPRVSSVTATPEHLAPIPGP